MASQKTPREDLLAWVVARRSMYEHPGGLMAAGEDYRAALRALEVLAEPWSGKLATTGADTTWGRALSLLRGEQEAERVE